MDWILENIGKLFPLLIFVFYALSALKRKGAEEEVELDPESQERARRIQEEIRRKILERQQGSSPRPVPHFRPEFVIEEEEVIEEPEPSFLQDQKPAVEPVQVAVAPQEYTPVAAVEDPFAAQRRQIEEQLQKAKALHAKARRKDAATHSRKGGIRMSSSQVQEGVRRGVADSNSLKTAFVLKEILDTPIGMR